MTAVAGSEAKAGHGGQQAERQAPVAPMQYGSRDDLLGGRELRTRDVTVTLAAGQKVFKVRELTQDELDQVNAALLRQEADQEGKITSHFEQRGFKARTLAYALVTPGMQQLFPEPSTEWELINKRLTPDVIDLLYEAVDQISPMTKAAREKLAKNSERAATS